MKKKYVKPVIEAEEFETNEYCEPCYIVECDDVLNLGHKPFLIKYQPTVKDDRTQPGGDNFQYNESRKKWYYTGDMGGIQIPFLDHPVNLKPTKGDDGKGIVFNGEHVGPNAS